MDSAVTLKTLSSSLGAEPVRLGGQSISFNRVVQGRPDAVLSWRGLMNKMRQGLCVFDAASRLVLCNRRYAEIYNLSPDALQPGMTLAAIVALRTAAGTMLDMGPDDYARWHERIVSQGDDVESVVRLCDGRVVAIHHSPQSDGGWVATHDDITDRLPAERALQNDAALLSVTLACMDQGLIVVDEAGIVRLCNDRVLQMLDLPEAVMRAQPSFESVVRAQLANGEFGVRSDEIRAWLDRDERGALRRVYEHHRPNGAVIEMRAVPLPGGGTVRTYMDVTERKRAETRIAESEARLRALTDSLPQMVWLFRASDGEVAYSNQRFRDYVGEAGWARVDRIGSQHPEERDRVKQAWVQAKTDGVPFEVEARWRRWDGVYRWHKIVIIPTFRDGSIVEWIGTALDIDDIVVARDMLLDKTSLLQLAQEAAGAGLFDWCLANKTGHFSPESLRLLNIAEDRATDLGVAEVHRIVHPDDLPDLLSEGRRAVATATTFRAEFRVPRPDGLDRWILGVGRVVLNAAGRPLRIVGLNIDLTERKRVEETLRLREAALRSSEERLAFALDAGSDGLWDWTIATGEVWYSDRWQTMLGYAPGELEPHLRTWERLISPDDHDRATALLTAHFEGRAAAYECEHRLRRKDGGWGWVLARGKVVARDAQNAPLRIVGTHADITERKVAEAQVAHLACHDALTDLPNRTLFRERLDQKLAEVRRHSRSCAVFCLDLDRFKAVNDTLGHQAGDLVLQAVAQRLRINLRAEDTVARVGGDEFVVLLDNPGEPLQIATLAERLIEAIAVPIAVGEHKAEVGLSVGIALAPDHGVDGEGMLKRADLALYRAKAAGRNTHRFFEPAMDEMAAKRRSLERDLRFALRNDQLVLHYQPQIRGATGEAVGFEALVRWQHPRRGLVMPNTFIPLAEESGLIVQLGEWVLRTACREAMTWRTPLKIALNVSPRQFQHADLANMIAAVLAETGLPAERLELEITEGVIITDAARALRMVERLKGLGVRVAIDDFGTGYSSLTTLQAFPFDTIKIDRSFVGRVEDSPQAAAIVRAVLGLGRSLGMGVVAEGVETEAQMRFLLAEACEEMQGYLFGKPQPLARAVRWVTPPQGRQPSELISIVRPGRLRLSVSGSIRPGGGIDRPSP